MRLNIGLVDAKSLIYEVEWGDFKSTLVVTYVAFADELTVESELSLINVRLPLTWSIILASTIDDANYDYIDAK